MRKRAEVARPAPWAFSQWTTVARAISNRNDEDPYEHIKFHPVKRVKVPPSLVETFGGYADVQAYEFAQAEGFRLQVSGHGILKATRKRMLEVHRDEESGQDAASVFIRLVHDPSWRERVKLVGKYDAMGVEPREYRQFGEGYHPIRETEQLAYQAVISLAAQRARPEGIPVVAAQEAA